MQTYIKFSVSMGLLLLFYCGPAALMAAERTVKVNPVPADPKAAGKNLLEALADITTNSATNPWLIELEPGVYDLGTASLTMKPYVDIKGSGEDVTTIVAVGSNSFSGTVIGATNAELRFLTVANTGGFTNANAVFTDSTSPKLTHVTLNASGGGNGNTSGLFSQNAGTPLLTDVTVNVPPGTNNFGIWILNGASAVLRNVTVTVGASPNHSYGVIATNANVVTMVNVNIVADAFGLVVEPSQSATTPVTVDRSTIKGNSGTAVVVNSFGPPTLAVQIGASQLIGSVSGFPLSITCVYDYNGSYAPLNASCQ